MRERPYIGWRLIGFAALLLALCVWLLAAPLYEDDFGDSRWDPAWVFGPLGLVVFGQMLWTGIRDVAAGERGGFGSPVHGSRPALVFYAALLVLATIVYVAVLT